MRLNVILDIESTTWLDEHAVAVRRISGAALSRSELLRGILAGLRKANMDFSLCRTEREVGEVLNFLLRANRSR